jgi:uridine phosphorylase
MIVGNTVTTPGFYAPQGRMLRNSLRHPQLLEKLRSYSNEGKTFRLTNFEMETAGYYSLARLLGHQAISVNAIVANRVKNTFSKEPGEVVDRLIKKVLNRWATLV